MRVRGADIVVLGRRLSRVWKLPASSERHRTTVATAAADDVLRRLRNHVDSRTYVKLFQRCMELRDAALAEQVRDHILQSGRRLNIFERNTLIKLYALCGSLDDARRVFDSAVDKTVVTWNAIIAAYAQQGRVMEAIALFRQMRPEPNTITYLTVLDACSTPGALVCGREIHAQATSAGFASDFRVGTALVNMYVKGGSMEDARRVFDGLTKLDVSTFNAMISGYAKNGDAGKAFELFRAMHQGGTNPNRVSYLSILDACSGTEGLSLGQEIHEQCLKAGALEEIRVATALIRMYAKCGSILEARDLFEKMPVRDLVAWTVMIEGYVASGDSEEAFRVFSAMRAAGIRPDKVTYIHLLNACADLRFVREVHSDVAASGFGEDLLVSTVLVHMYSSCGAVEEARRVFDNISNRDVVSWSAMIGGYAENGYGDEAFEVFHEMRRQGVEPEAVTYINMLKRCYDPGVLELGREIHSQVRNARLVTHLPLGNALVNMYSKCGSVEDARHVFESMVKRDTITWNAMIGGYAQYGYAREALELFAWMLEEGVRPNSVTFVGVLSACSRAGLVSEGRRLFTSLVEEHGIVPTMELYGCMVDVLARAGKLEEAEELINDMPLEASATIWSSLLAACRIHGNLEMAERAAEGILTMDPGDGAVYVQLSHMYAAAGMWENVAKVRRVMEGRGVKKEQGCTRIRINGKVHTFVTEDRSHPEAREIYTELGRLMLEIKREGHLPLTQSVLHDVGERQKEEAVSYHSEKLAIVYGIMSTPPGTPIRIYKNLRVCADCHSASKFISKAAGREIIARDASRFHHFKNGVCSCGDYW